MNDPFLNHKEPEEVFLSLDERRYAQFYAIEMVDFNEDISFYQKSCTKGSRILELGCGSGRISQALASSGYRVTGLDTSHAMLMLAQNQTNSKADYICMDMCRMAFCTQFDHILIPYNTLNLLRDESAILCCLQQIRELLAPEGSLIAQIYIPDRPFIESNGRKIFQFQMFPLPGNKGKLIKETLRSYLPEKKEIILEERYRTRPTAQDALKENLRHQLCLAGFPLEQWLSLLHEGGFHTISLHGSFDTRPFEADKDTLLLIKAKIS